MSAIGEIVSALIERGMSPTEAATLVARAVIEGQSERKKSAGAARTQRWRERHNASQNVTASQPNNAVTVTPKTSQNVTVTPTPEITLLLTPSTSETKNPEKKESKRAPKKQTSPLPENWTIPARAREIAAEISVDLRKVEPRFRDYLLASGKQYVDYDAAFCNFVRNTPRFNGNGGNGSHGPPRRQKGFLDLALELSQDQNDRHQGPTIEHFPFDEKPRG